MGDVIDFKSKVKTTDDGPEELCCPDCGCDTFRLDSIGFYCVGCYEYLVVVVYEGE